MNLLAEIGKTLKLGRTAKALSQAALAKRAVVQQSHISRIENARVDLRLCIQTKLTLGNEVEYVYPDGKEEGPEASLLMIATSVLLARGFH